MEKNQSKQSRKKDNKFEETLNQHLRIFRGVLYLTKKIFML